MELRHLRYFAAVAAEGNFTRAAEKLGVAQPPLSRQIRDLELELGVDLFDRDQRPVRLTEAGRLFHEQTSAILASLEQMRRTMGRFVGSDRRRYVIGAAGSVIYGAMPQVIRALKVHAPGVDVQLLEMTTLEQVQALKEGRIDAGLGRIRIDDDALRREVLYEEPLVVALSAGHPLAGHERLALDACATDTLVIYPSQPRPSYADQVLALLRDRGLTPPQIVEVREVQTALGLVAAQAGLALVPASMRHMHRDDLVYRPLSDEGVSSPIILSRRASDLSTETLALEAIAREIYGALAPGHGLPPNSKP